MPEEKVSRELTATLQCRHCLEEWETPVEYLPVLIGGDEAQLGTVTNYEIAKCPHCGNESFWDVTL